jgi:hypothetical protein
MQNALNRLFGAIGMIVLPVLLFVPPLGLFVIGFSLPFLLVLSPVLLIIAAALWMIVRVFRLVGAGLVACLKVLHQ